MAGRWIGRMALAALVAAPLSVAVQAAPEEPAEKPAYTNRLITSADPYLLLHAHNPVDWYPWGPEAFAKARAENKPIFLSIGYSTCYWCHVAETEIYSNPAIAAVMNRWFVNVKVDREQRPDVDRLYIIATEMLTDHGAWPNNLFLTPDLKPFYAGSYFPPTDEPGGTPGFPTVLAAIHDLWENHRAEKVDPAADSVMRALREVQAKQAADAAAPVDGTAWMRAATQVLVRGIDPIHGGLGNPTSGPKFPQAPALALLAADARRGGAPATALDETLDAMAYGGIHDQLAGGFHRYSTEPTWSVPHFEKMLSDNAQLLALYADAYARTRSPLDRAIARETVGYLIRDMALPDGGFATAQDAETRGVEGATYLWTRAEIEAVLGATDTQRFLDVYDLVTLPEGPRGSAPDAVPAGVLRVRLPIADTLARAGYADPAAMLAAFAPQRAKLLAARAARPQPARDDKVVTELNGLAISGLARAGIALDDATPIAAATKAATRIWSLAHDAKTGALAHQIYEGRADGAGYLGDYAAFGDGLLDLAAATHDDTWRADAVTLADAMIARFLRADGTLATGTGDDALPIALEDGEDADAPSGTSSALALLLRLGAAPDGARFESAAATVASHLAARIAKQPSAWPSAIVAIVEHPPAPAALATAGGIPTRLASTSLGSEAPAPRPDGSGVPSTADHVHASATAGPGDTVVVSLAIDAGFHINAHVPSLDYLVPTALAFDGPTPTRVDYPPPVTFKPSFAKGALDVYEGTATLVAHFKSGALSGRAAITASVSAQACDAQTCLPPATLPVTIAKRAGSN